MNALLLVAHGSRRPQSNREVTALAEKLSEHCSEHYAAVHSAFLELAEPSIPEGIRYCVDKGAITVVVLPYFLNSGRHVVDDIPAIVNESRATFPDIEIKMAPHIGASDLMTELLLVTANNEIHN